MRYFIQLSYDGTAYHGWQRQPNGVSVQETLEGALGTILRKPIEVVGAGRTDAGVHARMMVAHMDCLVEFDCGQLAYKLNNLLPRDISIQRIWPVEDDAHARFSATSRTYHYYIHRCKDPFLRHYSWQVTFPLDFKRMNDAASRLLQYEDFTSFSKTQTDTKTNLCRVTEARWEAVVPSFQTSQMSRSSFQNRDGQEGYCWCFTITANRFLRNMVRAIVGTLVEVGRGRISVDEFCRIIERKDRCAAGDSVPGHALFLVDIQYPLNL